jgi:eukaryotic-like serine/threonine-protein kinase
MTAVETAQEELFGPYVVYERLGVGGMASVHRARELGIEGFERIVALKRLLPHLAEDATFIRSFVREAKLASILHHVNVVQIFELGRVGTQYFISMEHIDGKDLRKILRQARRHAGPPPIGVTLGLLLQLCDALDYAHTMVGEDGQPLGLVHRDVSPSNILINRAGYLKVIDFGIAKAQTSQLKTQTGRVKGKLAYMAPEAVSGKELDARSDLFAAGVIAHELLTARPLFACKNEYQTLLRVQRGEILPPSHHNRSCPPELDAIVLRALARDPNDRYESAAAMRDDLLDLRAKFQLAATHREIGSWIDWAFSVAEASTEYSLPHDRIETRSPLPRSERTSTRNITSNTPIPMPPPAIAPKQSPMTAEEEELVDVAWGNQAQDSGAPVLMDDIPDVSSKLAHQAAPDSGELSPVSPGLNPHTASRRPIVAHAAGTSRLQAMPDPTPAPIIGSSLAARNQPRSKLPIVGAIVGAAAAAAVVFMFTMGGDKSEPSATGGAPGATASAAGTRYAKFTTEPADARILIDGTNGHIGTPWKVELTEGPHDVEISGEGYKTWRRQIEVDAGETQSFHVMLEKLSSKGENYSTLRVRPTPAHFDAEVDGIPVAGGTPFEMELAPGIHRIVLRKNSAVVWKYEQAVQPATTYELAPTINDRARPEPGRRDDDRGDRVAVARPPAAAAGSAQNDIGSIGSGSSGSGSAGSAAGSAGSGSAGSASGSAGSGSAGSASGSAGSGSAGSAAVAVAPVPPPRPVAPAAPAIVAPTPKPVAAAPVPQVDNTPAAVGASAVKRLSGNAPNLRAERMDDLPKVISAKLCIDTSGKVTSVNIIQQIDGRFVKELQTTMKGWKYAPYKLGGVAKPACFVVPMRTK